MALINTVCKSCEVISEVYRAAKDHPWTPPCEKCGAETEQIHLPRGTVTSAPAVVVYAAPDGTFRFPGTTDPHSQTAQQYAKLGYERQEFRGFAEVRRLEGKVSKQQAGEISRSVERQCRFREESMSYRRSEVRRGLAQGFQIPETDEKGRQTGRMKTVHMSVEARDMMRAVMDRNDRKPPPKAGDSGFHVEVYSQDRSNRDDSRGPDGRRYRD